MAAAVDERLEHLREWITSQRVGALAPQRVDVLRTVDSLDRPAWMIIVTLGDPPDGAATWPVDDVVTFDREIRDKAIELDVEWPWYVDYQTGTIDESIVDDEPDSGA
jgi:hypothetical protein